MQQGVEKLLKDQREANKSANSNLHGRVWDRDVVDAIEFGRTDGWEPPPIEQASHFHQVVRTVTEKAIAAWQECGGCAIPGHSTFLLENYLRGFFTGYNYQHKQ